MSVYKGTFVHKKPFSSGPYNVMQLIALLSKLLGWQRLDPTLLAVEYKLPSGKILRLSVISLYQYQDYRGRSGY